MGPKITAKCLPGYFDRLEEFGTDYRQFDEITFVNTATGEEKTFDVDGVRRLDDSDQGIVRDLTPEVPWDEGKQIYAIDLAKQQKRKQPKRGNKEV